MCQENVGLAEIWPKCLRTCNWILKIFNSLIICVMLIWFCFEILLWWQFFKNNMRLDTILFVLNTWTCIWNATKIVFAYFLVLRCLQHHPDLSPKTRRPANKPSTGPANAGSEILANVKSNFGIFHVQANEGRTKVWVLGINSNRLYHKILNLNFFATLWPWEPFIWFLIGNILE